jgi:hypothetical protein
VKRDVFGTRDRTLTLPRDSRAQRGRYSHGPVLPVPARTVVRGRPGFVKHQMRRNRQVLSVSMYRREMQSAPASLSGLT